MAVVPKLSARGSSDAKIHALSPGRLLTSMTCDCRECCTHWSCAVRTLTPPSIQSIQRPRRAPGVVAVLTGADLKDKIGTLPCAAIADHKPFHPVLAEGKVRYVGEPVAVVVAADPYKAQDALDLVEVDYDPLDAVVDPEKALEPGAPDPRNVRHQSRSSRRSPWSGRRRGDAKGSSHSQIPRG